MQLKLSARAISSSVAALNTMGGATFPAGEGLGLSNDSVYKYDGNINRSDIWDVVDGLI